MKIELTKKELIVLLGNKCLACNTRGNLTLDRIIPGKLGGEYVSGNMQVLCRPCNSVKGGSEINFITGQVPQWFSDRLNAQCPTCKFRAYGFNPTQRLRYCRLCGTRWEQVWGAIEKQVLRVPEDWKARLKASKQKQRINAKKYYENRKGIRA